MEGFEAFIKYGPLKVDVIRELCYVVSISFSLERACYVTC